jgi:hypothetical protein
MLRVQFGGPWLAPGVPLGASLRYTHWAAQRFNGMFRAVYDINVGWWCPWEQWARTVIPWLGRSLQQQDRTWRRWDGSWTVRDAVVLHVPGANQAASKGARSEK